jgi:hypothetical protein
LQQRTLAWERLVNGEDVLMPVTQEFRAFESRRSRTFC